MPFNSQGHFTRVMNWTNDYQNGVEIVCDRHDEEDDNFASGFNDCFCRDGRATATGNFKMGNFKITGLGNGTIASDAVNKSQLDTVYSTLTALISSSIATAIENIFPVGSVCIGTQSTCPLATLIPDSEWELVGKDYALWTGDGTNANTTINAGLPNITATGGSYVEGLNGTDASSGAINRTSGSGTGYRLDTGGGTYFNETFDASQSNAIYGNSTTVQPPAYIVNVWRRTA